jgi:magnesium-transporting ATPase (P-type)
MTESMVSAFCDWLSATPLSGAFQDSTWFVPLVQTVHILSVATFLVAVFVIGSGLIRLHTQPQALAALVRGSMPRIWIALAVLLLTGGLLTITEPARELLNWAFRVKMILVVVLGVLLRLLQSRARGSKRGVDILYGRVYARLMGVVLLLIGTAIVTAGRWIAYVA